MTYTISIWYTNQDNPDEVYTECDAPVANDGILSFTGIGPGETTPKTWYFPIANLHKWAAAPND